jgi:hypothetical protein
MTKLETIKEIKEIHDKLKIKKKLQINTASVEKMFLESELTKLYAALGLFYWEEIKQDL